MNSLVLGGILKRIYSNFSMELFKNRLKLQKIIYLLQEKGINLGYNYSFYIYGPYSPDLTSDGFSITHFDKVKPVGFENKDIESTFLEFLQYIKPYKNNIDWLEIATSIHLLKKICPEMTKAVIINKIRNKRAEFNGKKEYISGVWDNIEGWVI